MWPLTEIRRELFVLNMCFPEEHTSQIKSSVHHKIIRWSYVEGSTVAWASCQENKHVQSLYS